jgi:hypothetical protein
MSTSTVPSGQPKTVTDQHAATTIIPGVPNLPDVVTVVPFYWRENEDDAEKTKVVIQAEVDGRHGIFIVDLGSPTLILNRTFLQPSATGGVDTVTDANRIPYHAKNAAPKTWDKVHATMRIGTLLVKFDDPVMKKPYNAYLGNMWGNFEKFAPRLGNIGPSVLEQFETIVDYTHRRLVLIRLDSAGHRLAIVPAYTPRRTVTFSDIDLSELAGVDFGMFWGMPVRPDGILDTLDASKNTLFSFIDTGSPDNEDNMLGYPFLRQFGVIGFNHRTHQVMLYH